MTDIHGMPGHLIRRLNQISTSVFAERMEREGLDCTPVQYAALATIAKRPDIDQASLAGLIAYDRATLGNVVERLDRKGLVARQVCPQDRRSRQLRLTSQGERMLDRLKPVVEDLQNDILSGLSESETDSLMALLRKATTIGNARSRAPVLADTGKTRARKEEA
ncbi:MAG: MarR family winged helix-turn-helix transcriptional regulator [Pseudomonadota bacterium]